MKNRSGLAAVLLLSAVLLPAPLPAQTVERPPRVTVLATLGAMWPTEAEVSELYNGAFMPVTIEADVRLLRRFFVFGSGQFAAKDGAAVFNVPPAPEERFPLRLSTSSLRIGGGMAFPWHKWLFCAQGGLSYTAYSEQWTGEDVPEASGHAYGMVIGGGVDYQILKKLWAVGRFEYAYSPTGDAAQTTPTFDLSGVSVSGGVAVRF